MKHKLIFLAALLCAQATTQTMDIPVAMTSIKNLDNATNTMNIGILTGLKEDIGNLAELVKENPGTTFLVVTNILLLSMIVKFVKDFKKTFLQH